MKSPMPNPSVSQVRDSVVEHIRKSGVAPGGRLPTERELHKIVGVSRNRIRDALAALESQGIVSRLVGSGTYLTKAVGTQADGIVTGDQGSAGNVASAALSPSQLIEARIVFEVSLSCVAVRNATDQDLHNLEEVVNASEEVDTEDEFEKLDAQFHHLIAIATHNDLLIQFSQMIARGRQAVAWRRLKQQSTTLEKRVGYRSDHRRILQALQDRSAEDLSAALRDHLVSIRRAVLGI